MASPTPKFKWALGFGLVGAAADAAGKFVADRLGLGSGSQEHADADAGAAAAAAADLTAQEFEALIKQQHGECDIPQQSESVLLQREASAPGLCGGPLPSSSRAVGKMLTELRNQRASASGAAAAKQLQAIEALRAVLALRKRKGAGNSFKQARNTPQVRALCMGVCAAHGGHAA